MILEVWYDEVYTGDFYVPKASDVVIDAGANVGLFSLLVARIEPQTKVFAFEPFPENFAILQSNLDAAGARNVQSFNKALSGTEGQAIIRPVGGRSQDHRLEQEAASDLSGQGKSVDTVSLSDIVALVGRKPIAMFKCDIEGSEYDVFASAEDEDLRLIDRCAIEWHEHLRPGVTNLLRSRLEKHHRVDVKEDGDGKWGMMYAQRK
ncbi:FkbM family methyltransferase [Botrimarina sp.]|uniref:FkbM family methyltransferase n=1 Tax=Botrimarina sp. TaxID=2795802 RepID=UPI0032EE05B8